nr:MAG TPA: hypothetical protein [Caudoviricetes sp.]
MKKRCLENKTTALGRSVCFLAQKRSTAFLGRRSFSSLLSENRQTVAGCPVYTRARWLRSFLAFVSFIGKKSFFFFSFFYIFFFLFVLYSKKSNFLFFLSFLKKKASTSNTLIVIT